MLVLVPAASTVFADPAAADEAIDKHLSTTASTIVVHCAQSKQVWGIEGMLGLETWTPQEGSTFAGK